MRGQKEKPLAGGWPQPLGSSNLFKLEAQPAWHWPNPAGLLAPRLSSLGSKKGFLPALS